VVSEFERLHDLRQLPARPVQLEASKDECAALAARFGLVAVKRLEAAITLAADGPAVRAEGRLMADIVQSCAVSGEDLPVRIDEPVALRFVPAADLSGSDEEIELDSAACDEIELDGTRFDLGEALAQELALAIDPFASGPGADEARRRAGLLEEGANGPFAALAGLANRTKPPG
jgi:uncharacterized metal-binding protein YceD (DUF177 family)